MALSAGVIILIVLTVALDGAPSVTVDVAPAQCEIVTQEGVFVKLCKKGSDLDDIISNPFNIPPSVYGQHSNDVNSIKQGDDDVSVIEGDIMTYETPENKKTPGESRTKRKIDGGNWPRNIIPWEVDRSLPAYSQSSLNKIKEAMGWWMKHTCVKFVPASSNRGSNKILSIKNEISCASYVGYRATLPGNKQSMRLLESHCFSTTGTPAHELGHTLGLIHEHTRPDRDEHVKIDPNLLSSKSMHNFEKSHESKVYPDVSYDLSSIMHYRPTSFSTDGSKPVILSHNLKKQSLMGQRESLSFYDIKAVNINYGCKGSCNNRCENEGYPHYKNGRCICVCPEGLSGSSCQKVDSSCGGTINVGAGQTTRITSPGHPAAPSSGYDKCVWLIAAPTGYYLEVNFEQFDVAKSKTSIYQGAKCLHNVEIRNNMLGQRGDVYCGKGPVSPVNTEKSKQMNRMMIVLDMKDRSATRGSGFSASVKAYADGCLSNPCMSGATCISQKTSSFTCRCPSGYTGRLCDVITDGGLKCDFSKDMCGLTNKANDQLDFHREFRAYKYKETIERFAGGNKFFLTAPVEYSMTPGSVANLVTPTFDSAAKNVRCLSFFYKVDGFWQQGTLTVSLVSPTSGSVYSTIATLTKSSGNGWKSISKQINERRSYKIQFSFKAGSSRFNSLMALDDIEVKPQSCFSSPCSSNPCSATGSVCVETSTSTYKCICANGRSGSRCDAYDTSGFTCNFDSEDLCGWSQDKSDNFDWIRTYGASDALERTGPTTSASGYGYYLVADTSVSTASIGTSTRIISPQLKYTGPLCVSFYYHMYGNQVGSLRLKTRIHNRLGVQSHFEKSNSQSKQWLQESVDLHISNPSTQIVFEATVGYRHLADIAVDDIKMTRGRCSQSQSLQITTASPIRTNAAISMPPVRAPVLTIAPQAGASTSIRSSNTVVSARRTATSTHTHRSHTVVPITRTATSSLTYRSNTRAPVSRTANSIRTHTTTGIQNTPSLTLVNCDFERDLCNQYLTVTDLYRILRRTHTRTPSWNTGPDRASQGTYYVHMEGSSAQQRNYVELKSTYLRHSGIICITFDYHMYGDGIGNLKVITEKNNRQHIIWQKMGQQGQNWINAAVQTTISMYDKVAIKIDRGSTPQSDIALDNLKIVTGSCGTNRQTTRSTHSTRSAYNTQRTPATYNSINFKCDFEGGSLCQFVNSKDDNIDWLVHTGPTRSIGTGPLKAFSGKNYLYIEASYPASANFIARLRSPTVSYNAGDVCLEFHYHLKGADLGRLRVYQKFSDDSTRLILNRDKRYRRDQWQHMRTILKSNRKSYQVIFEANTGAGVDYWSSDIALDNLKLYAGRCA